MDDFFKNLKDRFSFDSVVSFMKDAKLIGKEKEEPRTSTENKADDIPRTTVMDVDGTPIIITDTGSMSKTNLEDSNNKTSISNKSSFSILQKSSSHEVKSDVESKTEATEKPVKKPIDVPLFF